MSFPGLPVAPVAQWLHGLLLGQWPLQPLQPLQPRQLLWLLLILLSQLTQLVLWIQLSQLLL